MIEIDRSYTIRFSYAGVNQYADFRESKGVLVNPKLSVSWSRSGEIPDVSQAKNINEVLTIIKSFAYGKKADIYSINGNPPFYEKMGETKKMIEAMKDEYNTFIDNKFLIFFSIELAPMLRKNNWKLTTSQMNYPVLIEKVNDEWVNVRDEKKTYEFEYLCAQLLLAFGMIDKIDRRSEANPYHLFVSHKVLWRVNIEETEFFVNMD